MAKEVLKLKVGEWNLQFLKLDEGNLVGVTSLYKGDGPDFQCFNNISLRKAKGDYFLSEPSYKTKVGEYKNHYLLPKAIKDKILNILKRELKL